MIYDKVIIKQIPEDDDNNRSAFGLGKYKRSRFPHCTDVLQAALLPGGKYLTGLDPQGMDIISIKDEEERLLRQRDKKNLLDNLNSMLPNVDLGPTSIFWETFYVSISTDQDLILNKFNPIDVIKYHLLITNGYVAPHKDYIGHPKYMNCKYFCHVDEVEESEKFSVQKLRDQAKSELVKISDNKDYMLLLGKYLEGGKYKEKMLASTLYTNLSDYIENRKSPENVGNFLKAVKKSVEELQFKLTVDLAIKKKIIKYKEGQYTRGGVNFGKTAVDVINNLKLPEYANEFIQIHEEVNNSY